MEELRLTRPTEAMSGEISAYRQAMLDAGSEMDGCGPLSRMEDPAEWIAFCKTLDERPCRSAGYRRRSSFAFAGRKSSA
mgnify:CR=1 FL=1